MPEYGQYDGPKHVACIDETNKNLLWLAVCVCQFLISSFLTRVDAFLHIDKVRPESRCALIRGDGIDVYESRYRPEPVSEHSVPSS
jgi:hypothetical protein